MPTRRGSRWVPPPPGISPSLHLGLAELGLPLVVRADADAAGHGELEPAAQTGAVDGGHHRLPHDRVEPLDAGEQPLALAERLARRRRVLERLQPADVGPGEEVVPLGRADDQRLYRRLAFDLGDHRGQVAGQLGVHRVEGLSGTVEQGDGDSVVDGEMDVGEGEVGGGHGSALQHQRGAEAPGGALGDQRPTRAPPAPARWPWSAPGGRRWRRRGGPVRRTRRRG